jgi:Fe2+ transport system protein FeoA
MSDLCLSDVPLAGKGRVLKIGLPADDHRRLMEMGLTRGTAFEVVRYAPLGDPIEIRVRGYNLSLRRNEARAIAVEMVS